MLEVPNAPPGKKSIYRFFDKVPRKNVIKIDKSIKIASLGKFQIKKFYCQDLRTFVVLT